MTAVRRIKGMLANFLSLPMKGKLERIAIVLCFIGLFFLCQPFSFTLYTYGFQILGIGGLIYILLGYMPPGSSTTRAIVTAATVIGIALIFIILGILLAPILVG